MSGKGERLEEMGERTERWIQRNRDHRKRK